MDRSRTLSFSSYASASAKAPAAGGLAHAQQTTAKLTDALVAAVVSLSDAAPPAARFVVDQITAMLITRLDPTMTPTEHEHRTDEQFLDACIESTRSYLRIPHPRAGG